MRTGPRPLLEFGELDLPPADDGREPLSVADVFDALVNARPYKPAWPADRALAEIEAQRGRQFDPDVIDAFLRVVERVGATRIATGRGP